MGSDQPPRSGNRSTRTDSFDQLLEEIAHAPPSYLQRLPALEPGAELMGGRFHVRSKLGAGGMGIVFEAMDTVRGGPVALKTLHRLDPARIYQLKYEFRRLADVAHPNLVTLHELFCDDDRWFFTMERIHGVPFDEWARPGGAPDHDRLRGALAGLAQGVQAIHGAGWLHCDLTPSNVLVEPSGRVRVLDFGLVAKLHDTDLAPEASPLMGTPLYMSPERAAGAEAAAADDWWAVGVMLFQSLTGTLPFPEHAPAPSPEDTVPDPKRFAPSSPTDLTRLCRGLLAPEPARRSGWSAFATFLEDGAEESDPGDPPLDDTPLLGRERELAVLTNALRATLDGQPRMVSVQGLSGMGKTALTQHFLADARENAALVFEGRCYEQETVPYKALDGLVDQLSAHLCRLPASQSAAVLPSGAGALARIFPVLGRVVGIGEAPAPQFANAEELREAAFTALKELLARLAAQDRVVVFVDDAQWGDADSAAALRVVLEPPDTPALLFLASFRSDEATDNPFVRALVQRRTQILELAPLSEAQVKQLVDTLRPGTDPSSAHVIARESAGNPLLVRELVAAPPGSSRPSLSTALLGRAAKLGTTSQRLLQSLAVAGHPIPRATALAAAKIAEADGAVARLRSARLVRTRRIDDQPYLETYHDRIRETLVESLSCDLRRRQHRELADAYAETAPANHEALTEHLLGAADVNAASPHAELAGDTAAGALGFDRAALFFDIALRSPGDKAATHSLEARYGAALSNAGRSRDAAEAFLRGARCGDGLERLDLEYRAAAEMVSSGDRAQGVERLRKVLEDLGVAFPRTRYGQAWRFLRNSAAVFALAARPPRSRRQPATPLERYLLEQVTPASLAALVLAAPWQFAFLTSEMGRYGLASGNPDYVSRVLCGFALISQAVGARKTARRLLDRAVALGATGPLDLSLQDMARGTLEQTSCRFASAADSFDQAVDRLDRHPGAEQERYMARALGFGQWIILLDVGELRRRLPAYARRVARAGDPVTLAQVDWTQILVRQLGEVEYRAERAEIERWRATMLDGPIGGDGTVLWGTVDMELVAGRPDLALEASTRLLRAGPFFTVLARVRHAMCAIACARYSTSASDRRSLLRAARWRRRQLAWAGQPLEPLLVDAGLARASGNDEREVQALRRVIDVAAEDPTYLDRSATGAGARFRLGRLLGGDEGRHLCRVAERTYQNLEICNSEKARRLWNWE